MSMSDLVALARPVTELFLIALAIALTASKSPLEEAGKPASIMSTPNRSSCLAISNFSNWFKLTPGDCSPSRSVVSKMLT